MLWPAAAASQMPLLKLSARRAVSSRAQESASAAASAAASPAAPRRAASPAQAARAAWRCWAARRDAVMAAYWAVSAAPSEACMNRVAA